MKILLACNQVTPVFKYGGTERVVMYLASALAELGHQVTILGAEGSTIFDTRVGLVIKQTNESWAQAIENVKDIDIVNIHFPMQELPNKKYIISHHGSFKYGEVLDQNSLFVSKKHASRYGSQCYVYHGLDWRDYGDAILDNQRSYCHFLGKAAWRLKNVKAAISIARKANEKLIVIGGTRLNLKMGFRFTPYPSIKFAGMVGGAKKNSLLQNSKCLIHPVKVHETFGLALIESLYFGCPVIGTPYGSLPELITEQYGFLSNKESELLEAVRNSTKYDRRELNNYALTQFNSIVMAQNYVQYYERVLCNEILNQGIVTAVEKEEKFLPFYE